ncbi:Protein of unknown function DUF2252 [Segniliparus rotundus DSM 44985]|uniref:DUF2252 domain-containing protein n=1 Tax=Segniliparus rotundus (strain ATCC BAA-972 / CDC 1076 / CIP 108378 / DSM 44985 / JCM 13578) TaxID=640132 RepID=D6ZD42_SEGRD|nr:DUF2252 domain-containing protein [Segniliparus rotundus]ADG99229.1 Protein of unknown function DUF2252 [Segniliparus rotundus DSM 44985]
MINDTTAIPAAEERASAESAQDSPKKAGKRARQRAPRKASGHWSPAKRAMPAIARLRAQEGVRDESLLGVRYARMASSSWAYLRGAAAVMAADLAAAPHSGLIVQMCGDAHILNFGLWASPERQLLFDARDFDETLPGPFEWDLKRLATSAHVLAAAEKLDRAAGEEAAAAAVGSYIESMRRYAKLGELDIWYDVITADAALEYLSSGDAERAREKIEEESQKKSHEGSVEKLTTGDDEQKRITSDPVKRRRHEAAHSPENRVWRTAMGTYLDSIPPHLQRLVSRFSLVDSVRQVVGVGSVGMRIYLNLMEGESGKQPVFFQMKQATASVYEEFLGPSEFDNHGQRVVAGQRLMQSASDLFLGWAKGGEFDYYVRQFRDMKVIPEGEHIAGRLPEFAALCGAALAKSHARSGEPAAISAYIGKGRAFTRGILEFARAYAAQTHEDHAELVAAIAAGAVPASENPW